MIADPLVSVIVPAWNAERTLRETLQSVASQTYRNLEILIVDDGSTDATPRIAGEFCNTDTRARLISQANGGVARARNRAIAEAKGNWVAPIDADDLWHPTKIEKQLAVALAAPERPGFVYCWHRLIDAESRVTGSGPAWELRGHAYSQLAYLNVVENGSALLLSREAVLEAGGYDPSLRARDAQGCEDVMVQLQIARRHPLAVVREYLVGHRRHGDNMSADFDRMVRSWRLAYRQLALEEPGIPPRILKWVNAKCALDIAEQRLAGRSYGAALKPLAGAIAGDPVRSSAILAYRLARSVGRRVQPARQRQLPLFSKIDPAAAIASDPHELKPLSRWLHRLNARRLDRLAQLDRQAP